MGTTNHEIALIRQYLLLIDVCSDDSKFMMCYFVVVGHRSNTECIDGSFVVKCLNLANDSYITVFLDAVLIPVSIQNVRFL